MKYPIIEDILDVQGDGHSLQEMISTMSSLVDDYKSSSCDDAQKKLNKAVTLLETAIDLINEADSLNDKAGC